MYKSTNFVAEGRERICYEKKKGTCCKPGCLTGRGSAGRGGAYTYLTGETEEVTNTFDTNGNGVELDESTGNSYDIVPGTSQEKDPTITATYTLDSYVFVKVTDATEELVTWYIANGWTLLSETENDDGSTTSVYSMLLKTADTSGWGKVDDSESKYNEQLTYTDSNGITYYYNSSTGTYTAVIPVLDDDTVYYSSSLTNEDLEDAEGITLTFQASIIQADPFADAENAWLVLNGEGEAINENTGVVSTLTESLSEASANDVIALLKNVKAESAITISTDGLTLDLGSHTLTANVIISRGTEVTLVNGDVESSSGYGVSTYYSDGDGAEDGTSLTLKNVDVTAAATAVHAWAADIVIDGGSVTSTENDAVHAEQGSTVTITDSEIDAAKIAVYANKATVTITNSSIESTGSEINAIQAENQSTITLKNVDVTAAGTKEATAVYAKSSEVVIEGGSVTSTAYFAVNVDESTITLKDVALKTPSTAVYAWASKVDIEGGSVTSTEYNAVHVGSSTATIKDSKITANKIAVTATNTSTVTITGSTIEGSTAINCEEGSSVAYDGDSSVTSSSNDTSE